MSTFGNAPSRGRSIDVEFNLLRTWGEARLDLHRRLAQRAAIGVVIVVVGAVAIPLLASARSDAAASAQAARAESREAMTAASARESRAEVVRPAVERESEILASARRANGAMSALATVLNAAPDTLTVRNLQFEVNAGVLTVKIRASAPDGETARDFARRVGSAPGIATAKASSITRDGDGVAFDFTSTGAIAL